MGRETIVEHICDNICKYPTNVTDQAQLEDICNGIKTFKALTCNLRKE